MRMIYSCAERTRVEIIVTLETPGISGLVKPGIEM